MPYFSQTIFLFTFVVPRCICLTFFLFTFYTAKRWIHSLFYVLPTYKSFFSSQKEPLRCIEVLPELFKINANWFFCRTKFHNYTSYESVDGNAIKRHLCATFYVDDTSTLEDTFWAAQLKRSDFVSIQRHRNVRLHSKLINKVRFFQFCFTER